MRGLRWMTYPDRKSRWIIRGSDDDAGDDDADDDDESDSYRDPFSCFKNQIPTETPFCVSVSQTSDSY